MSGVLKLVARALLWSTGELLFALAVLWVASQLSGTQPARHEQVLWPFSFRIAEQVTWPKPEVRGQFYLGATIIAAGFIWLLLGWSKIKSQTRLLLPFAVAVVWGLWVALPGLSVAAYPDTYRRSAVPYQAISIKNGEALYRGHCMRCHGRDATGTGPEAASLPKPAADLTAPHAGDHTPGDIYWWLTHGISGSGMPGFANRLAEDERWDLVNFVHTLATGYQARIIRERVVADRPWLGAPDFNFVAHDGSSGSLKDYREANAVLLVLFTWPDYRARLEELARSYPALQAKQAQVLAVPMHEFEEHSNNLIFPFPVVTEGAEEIARAYLLLRRTLENPRGGEGGGMPAHMEFLVDRFGYLRARWIPEDTTPGWRDARMLLAQVEQVMRERQVKPPPDEHLH